MNRETKNWIIKALNDYKTAQKLLNLPEDEIVTDSVCFHSQQFIEKVLKAFLVENEVEFGRVHNLEYLVGLCASIDRDFERLYKSVDGLTFYAVDVRYPDDFYIPDVDEAREAYELAREVKEFVFRFNIWLLFSLSNNNIVDFSLINLIL